MSDPEIENEVQFFLLLSWLWGQKECTLYLNVLHLLCSFGLIKNKKILVLCLRKETLVADFVCQAWRQGRIFHLRLSCKISFNFVMKSNVMKCLALQLYLVSCTWHENRSNRTSMSQYLTRQIQYAPTTRMSYRMYFTVCKPACFSGYSDPQSSAQWKTVLLR